MEDEGCEALGLRIYRKVWVGSG